MITFTPLKGMTGIALRFLNEPSPDRRYVVMGLDDIPPAEAEGGADGDDVGPDGVLRYGHIPLAERDRIIAGYLPHERESRSTGKPAMGSGLIYQTPESLIVEDVDPLSCRIIGAGAGGSIAASITQQLSSLWHTTLILIACTSLPNFGPATNRSSSTLRL